MKNNFFQFHTKKIQFSGAAFFIVLLVTAATCDARHSFARQGIQTTYILPF
jgi:hypothetical protein